MFPVAMVVVGSENGDSLSWFMELLIDNLDLKIGRGVTIICCKQKVYNHNSFSAFIIHNDICFI